VEIQWVIFDAVGTLIEPAPDVATVYHSAGVRFGSELSREEVQTRFRRAFRRSEEQDRADGASMRTSEEREEARWRQIVDDVFPHVSDFEACFRELYEHFASASAWRCFDDVAPTLEALRARGFDLAVASNFDHRLHPICDGNPPLRSLDRRFVSSEMGCRKPARSFYDAIVSDLDVAAGRILMVGDGLANDVRGARAAGLHTVHLDRKAADSNQAEKREAEKRSAVLPSNHSDRSSRTRLSSDSDSSENASTAAGYAGPFPVIGSLSELPEVLS